MFSARVTGTKWKEIDLTLISLKQTSGITLMDMCFNHYTDEIPENELGYVVTCSLDIGTFRALYRFR